MVGNLDKGLQSPPVLSMDEKMLSVSPGFEGLVTSSIDCPDPMHS